MREQSSPTRVAAAASSHRTNGLSSHSSTCTVTTLSPHIAVAPGWLRPAWGSPLREKRAAPVYQSGADAQIAGVTRVSTRDDHLVLYTCLASECTSGDLLYRFIRRTGSALTAVALITGMASACSDSPPASKASQPGRAASSTAAPIAQPPSRSGREQLNEEARDLLSMAERLESDEKGLVSAGTLAVPGQNLDETIESGTALRVEVACAGEGSVTFTVSSGAARTAERVACTQPMTKGFDFTTAGPSLAIQADSPEEDGVGTAYMVSHVS